MTTRTQDHPQRRPYHLLAGSVVFTTLYVFTIAFVRVALIHR